MFFPTPSEKRSKTGKKKDVLNITTTLPQRKDLSNMRRLAYKSFEAYCWRPPEDVWVQSKVQPTAAACDEQRVVPTPCNAPIWRHKCLTAAPSWPGITLSMLTQPRWSKRAGVSFTGLTVTLKHLWKWISNFLSSLFGSFRGRRQKMFYFLICLEQIKGREVMRPEKCILQRQLWFVFHQEHCCKIPIKVISGAASNFISGV